VHRHSQTPRADTKKLHKLNFLSFISQQTLRQHKLPDPCHHLIYSTTLKSEARTCQLLIAAEEKTSNPTQRCSLSFLCPRILHPDHFPPSLINEAPHILIDPPPSFPIPCQNTNTQASHANKISPCTNGTEIRRH
jgi:hypothetical protein